MRIHCRHLFLHVSGLLVFLNTNQPWDDLRLLLKRRYSPFLYACTSPTWHISTQGYHKRDLDFF
jgi:hypothetical protein